ncbi:MAG: sugar ABC transporter permease, partial [Myxococcales bacterium]|nr:sugar ABC transporter permease [Myxococcales bacterium]
MSRSAEALRRSDMLESAGAHLLVLLAVAFSLYPILWVLSLAFSGATTLEAQVLPVPAEPTLDNLREVVGSTRTEADGGEIWLFGRQLANSIAVSLATAVVGVSIAIPTAYAFARFEFLGKRQGMRLLLATQMFPAVASAVPLFMILEALELLNTRTGLVLCYASTS